MIRFLNIIQRRNFFNIGKKNYICDIYYSIIWYEICFEVLCIYVYVYVFQINNVIKNIKYYKIVVYFVIRIYFEYVYFINMV